MAWRRTGSSICARFWRNAFPQEPLPPADRLITGLPAFDETLGGGLTKGVITELSSAPPNAGSASIIAALLQRACRERYFIALIDGRDSFDPQSIGDPALHHLLWVRCHKASEAMQAADLLLRDGNFPLVILDLILNPLAELGRIPREQLVSPATFDRAGADSVSDSYSAEHDQQRAMETRFGESLDACRSSIGCRPICRRSCNSGSSAPSLTNGGGRGRWRVETMKGGRG